MSNPERLLESVREAGWALRIEGNRLICRLPEDDESHPLLVQLRLAKPDLIQLLGSKAGWAGGGQAANHCGLADTRVPTLSQQQRDAVRESIEERAAIQEIDGGLPRAEAKSAARAAMRVFHYRLTDKPDSWLVLIAPGCGLEEARRIVGQQFGADRVLEVRRHHWVDEG